MSTVRRLSASGGTDPFFQEPCRTHVPQARLAGLGLPRGPLGAGKRWAHPSGAGRWHLRRSSVLVRVLHPPVRSLRPVRAAGAVHWTRAAVAASRTPVLSLSLGVRGSPGRQCLMHGGRQKWGQPYGPRCPALGSFRGQGPRTRSGYGQTGLSSVLPWGEWQGEGVQKETPLPRGEPRSSWAPGRLAPWLVLPRTSLQTQAQPASPLALGTWAPAERPRQSWPPSGHDRKRSTLAWKVKSRQSWVLFPGPP